MVALAVLFAARPVLALAGDLERPSIAFPETTEPGWRDAVMKVLNQESAAYQGGRFINASTTLRYGGDAKALSQFLAGLAKCPGARIAITFSDAADANWIVEHSAWIEARRFNIRIRTGKDGLPLDGLRLPDIIGASEATPAESPR